MRSPAPPQTRVSANAVGDWITKATFVLAIIVLMFHTWEGIVGTIAQGTGIVLLLAAGGLSWALGHRPARPTPIEICVLLMVPLSLIRLMFYRELSDETVDLSFLFSCILLLIVISNAALVRRFSLKTILELSSTAIAISAVICVVVEYEGIIQGVTAGAGEKWSARLTPLGLHHNLAGIIFSLGILLAIYRFIAGSLWTRVFFLCSIAVETLIVIATGARGGILACVISLAIVLMFRVTKLPRVVLLASAGAAFIALLSIPYLDSASEYLTNAFELDSETRGFGTGATGRTTVWVMGIDYIFEDPTRLLFGSGLRTASPDEIGFSTENSYITIAIESGGFIAMIFFILLISLLVRLYYSLMLDKTDEVLISFGVISVIQYAMIESIFNRYLLAIGNPASVIFMLVFVGAWIHSRAILERRATDCGARPQTPLGGSTQGALLTPKQRRQARITGGTSTISGARLIRLARAGNRPQSEPTA